MQALRQHLFAGAALAQQHHGGGAGRHALDHAASAQHLGVAGEQTTERIWLVQRLQTPVLGLQFEQPERAVDRQPQQLRLEGLGEKVVGTQCDRAQRIRLVVLAGEHDHLDVGVQRQQLLQQAKALADGIWVGRQAQVHGDHRRLMPPELHQRALAVAGGDRIEAVQRPLDLLLQGQIVFDDQQRRGLAGAHSSPASRKSDPARKSNKGNSKVTTVPCPTSLFTSMLPPSSLTY